MWRVIVITSAAVACLQGQALSQITLCISNLKYGGMCVDYRNTCPSGSIEYAPYSNFNGCSMVNRKCCAYSPQGPIKNPNGVVVSAPQTCGIGSLDPSSRILDGSVTGPCDWPFAVSMRAKKDDRSSLTYEETSHACGGVIVGNQWVLTSPICIISFGNSADEAVSRMVAVVGDYNVSGIDIDHVTQQPMEQVIRLSRVYIHPAYKYKTQASFGYFDDRQAINSNGVALIKLSEPIKGRCSGIACLPTVWEAANDCTGYDECVITGWGYDKQDFQDLKNVLLLGRMRLTSRTACDFLTQRLNLTSKRPTGSACQSPLNTNTNSCLGDEGGAVICSNGNNWVVRGILPFNICVDGYYDFFVTDVNPYMSWIRTTMAN